MWSMKEQATFPPIYHGIWEWTLIRAHLFFISVMWHLVSHGEGRATGSWRISCPLWTWDFGDWFGPLHFIWIFLFVDSNLRRFLTRLYNWRFMLLLALFFSFLFSIFLFFIFYVVITYIWSPNVPRSSSFILEYILSTLKSKCHSKVEQNLLHDRFNWNESELCSQKVWGKKM